MKVKCLDPLIDRKELIKPVTGYSSLNSWKKWLTKHADFPRPVVANGCANSPTRYSLKAVNDWLQSNGRGPLTLEPEAAYE